MQTEVERRRWGPVLAFAAVAVVFFLATAIYQETRPRPPLAVFDIPPGGIVEAAYLDDGSPVFVIHLGGFVTVVSAVSTHGADGRMAWCPTSRTVDDWDYGSKWDPQGRYVAGPAPTDLAAFEIETNLDLRTVTVVKEIEPAGRSERQTLAGPPCDLAGGYLYHPGGVKQ